VIIALSGIIDVCKGVCSASVPKSTAAAAFTSYIAEA